MSGSAGWTSKQRQFAAIACKQAGIDENQRHLILYQLGGRAIVNGCATSTSPRLRHADFEKFLAIIEDYAGGQIGRYDEHHFQDKFANGPYGRLLYRARKLSYQLQDAGDPPMKYVAQAVGRDFENTLHNLDQDELNKAIDAMTAVIRRRGAA